MFIGPSSHRTLPVQETASSEPQRIVEIGIRRNGSAGNME
jgi:hypothetical protein